MAAAVGGPPSQGEPWPSGCRMSGSPEAETPGLGSVQPSQGGALQPPASFAGIGGSLPTTATAMYHGSVPINVGSSPLKGLEQPGVATAGPMGDVGMQSEVQEGVPVDTWMMMPQQQVPQQFYYEGQQMMQQQMQQQSPQGMPRGPGDGPAMGMGDGSQWGHPVEYAADGSGAFSYGGTCVLHGQALPPYQISPLPPGHFVGEQPMAAQPPLGGWQTGDGSQQDAIQPPATAAAASFGMCMSHSPGHQGRLAGAPDGQRNGGSWYTVQQQQQQQQQLGNQGPSSGGYASLPEAPIAQPKAEGKISRQSKSTSVRRRADTTGEGGPTGSAAAGQTATRPAKFFKKHSPAKAGPKSKCKSMSPQETALAETGAKGSADVPARTAVGPPIAGSCKASPGPLEGGEAQAPAPKAPPRSKSMGPSEVMAKMYFHRKKEAWRAELLIEGTKKQKSFSCRLYGYERARLMCEWARKFVLRTSRLPTDEETCTSLASLMKEPLPAQAPPAVPYAAEEYAAAPGGPQSAFAGAKEHQGATPTKTENQLLSSEKQAGGSTAARPGGTAVGCVSSAPNAPSLPGGREAHEQQANTAAAICKKRKEPAKTGETTTKVRKGTGVQGNASSKKGQQAPRGNPEGTVDSGFLGARWMEEPEMLRQGGPGTCREGVPAQQLLSPYMTFANCDSASACYATNMPVCGSSALQEMPQSGVPLAHVADSQQASARQEDETLGDARSSIGTGSIEQRSQEGNPWFEELEQLKKISRPKGGRAKRFNVGKKPFSGVRGIYFQQGLWKVKYRGDQEEAMKLFPYSPGDEKDMKSQFELARSFLRQVIDKGRHLHDSDGEGLSEDEPGSSSSKWTYRKETQQSSSKIEQPQLPRSPNTAANRRRAPASSRGPRLSSGGENQRGGSLSAQEDCWQEGSSSRSYFGHGGVGQSNGSVFSGGAPSSAVGGIIPPQSSGSSCWQQGTTVEDQARELQGSAAACGVETNGSERREMWARASDLTEAEPMVGHQREQLRLPMMPCGGVFKAADSPLSQRPSPKEKPPTFPHESSTGFFSAATTTTDEAVPLGICSSTGGGSDPNDSPATADTPRVPNPRYAQSYFGGRMVSGQAECKGSTSASCASPEESTMASHSSNHREQPLASSQPSNGFLAQPHMHSSGSVPPAGQFHCEGVVVPEPLPQSKGYECPLHFRPFADQHPRHLEAYLGEELLSAASHPCSFGGSIGSCQSPSQHLGQEAPAFPSGKSSGGIVVEQLQDSQPLSHPTATWGLDRTLALCKPKEEVFAGRSAVRPEALGYEASSGSPCQTGVRVATLPWVVVRPREEEEKALTPLAGKAAACFLQGSPTPYKYIQQQAN